MTTSAPSSTLDTDLYDKNAGPSGARTTQVVLQYLLETSIIHPDDWDDLSKETRDQVFALGDREALLHRLAEFGLVNAYQAARIKAGTFATLVMGNYRILGDWGADGGSVLYEVEHLLLRRKAAVKVIPVRSDARPEFVAALLRGMRAVARLNHPNIVAVFDAGLSPAGRSGEPDLYYFVMERLTGKTLEEEVRSHPLGVGEACGLIYQIASALDEAHRHQLAHRDINPANVFVTPNRQAKLLSLGLARYGSSNHAADPGSADFRTDIVDLGATLFFALTGKSPYSQKVSVGDDGRQGAQSARSLRAEIPLRLDEIIQGMITVKPSDSLQTPQAVMHALAPFLDGRDRREPFRVSTNDGKPLSFIAKAGGLSAPRLLIADPDPDVRSQLVHLLTARGLSCLEAADAQGMMKWLRSDPPAAMLLAVHLPGMQRSEMLTRLRENPPYPNFKVLMTSPEFSAEEMAFCLSAGADDYLPLEISDVQLAARVESALKHKEVQDRTDHLRRQLLALNGELERSLTARTNDLVQARIALVLALSRLVDQRSTQSIARLTRLQRFATSLAQEAAALPAFADVITSDWIHTLACSAPLHDIGLVALPDAVLLKSAKLTDDELRIMQTHTTIGSDTLQQVSRRFGAGVEFLHMAIDIARHHHEHYDGSGYPDRLAGDQIPLAARIVALADAYDSLRSRRPQRPGLAHPVAMQILLELSPGKFDPFLLGALQRCAGQFERIFRELPDGVPAD
jgi:response regulator RpfG family c-di-GMP phosphodiesterase